MTFITLPDNTLIYAALCGVFLIIVVSIIFRSKDATSRINIDDLLLDDVTGKFSKTACVFLGSFIFSTWMMVWLTLKGGMTEGYYTIYCGVWATPIIAKIIRGRDANANQSVDTPSGAGSTNQ